MAGLSPSDLAAIEAIVQRAIARALHSREGSTTAWVDHEQAGSASTGHTDAANDGTSTSSSLSMLEAEGRRFIANLQRKLKQKPGSRAPVRRRRAAR